MNWLLSPVILLAECQRCSSKIEIKAKVSLDNDENVDYFFPVEKCELSIAGPDFQPKVVCAECRSVYNKMLEDF